MDIPNGEAKNHNQRSVLGQGRERFHTALSLFDLRVAGVLCSFRNSICSSASARITAQMVADLKALLGLYNVCSKVEER